MHRRLIILAMQKLIDERPAIFCFAGNCSLNQYRDFLPRKKILVKIKKSPEGLYRLMNFSLAEIYKLKQTHDFLPYRKLFVKIDS